jgi:hypothetical protein
MHSVSIPSARAVLAVLLALLFVGGCGGRVASGAGAGAGAGAGGAALLARIRGSAPPLMRLCGGTSVNMNVDSPIALAGHPTWGPGGAPAGGAPAELTLAVESESFFGAGRVKKWRGRCADAAELAAALCAVFAPLLPHEGPAGVALQFLDPDLGCRPRPPPPPPSLLLPLPVSLLYTHSLPPTTAFPV